MKDETNLMVHYVPTGMLVREELDEQGKPTGDDYLEGTAVVFNQETVLWEDDNEKVSEIIEPTCMSREFLETQDVCLNLQHDERSTIARCINGKGSLELSLTPEALCFRCKVPKCDIGIRAKELVANGTYPGCSFEAYSVGYQVIDRSVQGGKKDILIVHKKFERLQAVTIALKPQYKQTSVFKREVDELTKAESALLKKEEEEREARHLLSREAQKRRERELAIMATECL